jgi:hypothetical protein
VVLESSLRGGFITHSSRHVFPPRGGDSSGGGNLTPLREKQGPAGSDDRYVSDWYTGSQVLNAQTRTRGFKAEELGSGARRTKDKEARE